MFLRLVLTLAVALAASSTFAGEAFPEKPIRIIVPFGPGQSVDVFGRIMGDQIANSLGKPVVVENRAGASGTIGSAAAAKSPADGYTLLVVSNGTLAGNTVLFKDKLPYNAIRDFAPIINFIGTPQILVVDPNSPYKVIADVVAAAKAAPGKLNYGTPGSGTSSHLAMEMFRSAAGISMVMVPYQGSPAALTDIMGGRIPFMFEAASGVMPLVRSGKVRVIANGGGRRASFLPDVPTVAESGYPGYDATPWVGLVAPAGTPRPIVDTLFAAANKYLESAEGKSRIQTMGAEPLGMNPDQFATHIKAEIDRWGKVVNDAGIKME